MHIANPLTLPFYLLPFYLLRRWREDLEEGNSHFGYWGKSIAHCKFVVFTFLPFTFLPFEGGDGAFSRTDTEMPPWLYGSGGSMVSRMGRERYRSLSSRSMSLPKPRNRLQKAHKSKIGACLIQIVSPNSIKLYLYDTTLISSQTAIVVIFAHFPSQPQTSSTRKLRNMGKCRTNH